MLNVATSAKDYASVALGTAYSRELNVEDAVESITSPDMVYAYTSEPTEITIKATPAKAVSGKMLGVSCAASYVTITPAYVTFDDNGEAKITVTGSMPGQATVNFTIGEMKSTSSISFSYEKFNAVADPVASEADGAELEAGTEIVLVTATEGATIFYTLDGSCPCVASDARMTYTKPIVVTKDVTLKAVAMKADMMDSEVVTYRYKITADGIARIASKEMQETIYTIDGKRVKRPLSPGVYIGVYSSDNGTIRKKFMVK